MSTPANPNLVQLTPYTAADEDQLYGNGLPDVREIHFAGGIMGVSGDEVTISGNSVLGLHATDVPLDTLKRVTNIEPGSLFSMVFDRLEQRAGLDPGEPGKNVRVVDAAWHAQKLFVIEPARVSAETLGEALPEFTEYRLVRQILRSLIQSASIRTGRVPLLDTDIAKDAWQTFTGGLDMQHPATLLSLGHMLFDTPQPGLKKREPTIITNANFVDYVLQPELAEAEKTGSDLRRRPPIAPREPLEVVSDPESSSATIRLGSARATVTFDPRVPAEDIGPLVHALMGVTAKENGIIHNAKPGEITSRMVRARLLMGYPSHLLSASETLLALVSAGQVQFSGDKTTPFFSGPRQSVIINSLLRGQSRAEISERLSLDSQTILGHLQQLKAKLTMPFASDNMLLLRLLADGQLLPNVVPPESNHELAGLVWQERMAYKLVPPPWMRIVQQQSSAAPGSFAAMGAPLREDGSIIHWGGGVFEHDIPRASHGDQVFHRALVLGCFGLSRAEISGRTDISLSSIKNYASRTRAELGLPDNELSAETRPLFDRGWLRVVEPIEAPNYMNIGRTEFAFLEALHSAGDSLTAAAMISRSYNATKEALARTKRLFNVSTRQLLLATYGVEVWKPVQDLEPALQRKAS